MQDMRAHLEKLKSEAEDCALISELAADPQKRVLFASLSRHLKQLASEVELAIQDELELRSGAISRANFSARPKSPLPDMRAQGVRGILVNCAEYRCSHSTALSGDT
jgi:hypothetical protein